MTTPIQKILMVCVGNICRSPMAEALMKDRINKMNLNASVSSAGLGALVDHAADPIVQEVLLEKEIDISAHRARQVTPEILFAADLILVMESRHKEELKYMIPSLSGRTYRLGNWSAMDIPDPYRKPKPFFEKTFELIEQGLNEWQKKLWG